MAGHGSPPAFDRGSDPRRQVGRQSWSTPDKIIAISPEPEALDVREEQHLDWAHEAHAKAYAKKYHHEMAPAHDRLS